MAAINPNFKAELDKLRHLTTKLSKQEVARATSAAINRSLKASETILSRAIREKYRLSVYELRGMESVKSKPSTLSGKIYVNQKPLSLARFNPKFISISNSGNTSIGIRKAVNRKGKSVSLSKIRSQSKVKRSAKGVSVEIIKGNPERIPYAFMINNDSHKPVFARGKYETRGGRSHFHPADEASRKVDGTIFGRLHNRKDKEKDRTITKLAAPSIYGITTRTLMQAKVSARASEMFAIRIKQELEYRISKLQS